MDTTKIITYTFSSGVEIKGTPDQIIKVAEKLGEKLDFKKLPTGFTPRNYYMSETRGLVKITDMSDYHIRRALLKRAKEYLSAVYDANDANEKFLFKFRMLVEDHIVVDLYTELAKRNKKK